MPPGEREAGGSRRYQGCKKYDPDKAPCICVSGEDKSKKRLQHARIHAIFDDIEDQYKEEGGSWSYNEAADTGTESVAEVMGCDENCTRAQLNKYHNQESKIPRGATLRADSSGQSTPSTSLKIV
jgi:hypothetical protein